eukprot:13398863-Alexandrium_andersonii.AAC.1
MSASLVGSEMCIRDSGCTIDGLELPEALGVEAAASLTGTAGVAGAVGTCLLYTSDAADDM